MLQVRPVGDAWLVSGSTAILDGAASPALIAALGWAGPPSANVLASQLQQLGRLHPRVWQHPAADVCTRLCYSDALTVTDMALGEYGLKCVDQVPRREDQCWV